MALVSGAMDEGGRLDDEQIEMVWKQRLEEANVNTSKVVSGGKGRLELYVYIDHLGTLGTLKRGRGRAVFKALTCHNQSKNFTRFQFNWQLKS